LMMLVLSAILSSQFAIVVSHAEFGVKSYLAVNS